MIRKPTVWRAAAAVLALALSACIVSPPDGAGEDRRETAVIESARAQGAERITAEIQMGAGALSVSGGAQELLEAEFTYNAPSLKPQVLFEGSGFRRRLSISHGNPPPSIGNLRSVWDIRLGGGVPLDLTVRCGAGESRLDLREVPLRSLEMHLGVGEVKADLRRKLDHDVEVKISGGVGRAEVLVPSEGVEATAQGGIGNIQVVGLEKDDGRWKSPRAGKTAGRLKLEVRGGIGEIVIRAG